MDSVYLVLLLPFILTACTATQPYGAPLRVCTSAWSPFVIYNDTTKELEGYEIDLWESVAEKLQLVYSIEVMDWGAMMDGLLKPLNDSTRCDIAPASIPVTTTALADAIQFSQPTFRSGYAVAVGVQKAEADYWGFTKVFSWEVWLALFVSGVGISFLVWLAERDFTRRGMGKIKYPQELRPGMYEAIYRTYGKLLNTVDEPKVVSLPAKFMVLGWGIVVLVTISTYTAGLTARLTAVQIRTKIHGISDLAGRKVGTWDAIAKNFVKYGIRPDPLPWNNEADGMAMLEMVATGELDALILDSPWLRYQLADRCDITIVGRMFQYVNNAVGFNANTPKEFIDAYNAVLSELLEDGFYETLELSYIRESVCGRVDPTTTITFWNLTGVYIIMVVCAGLGLVLMVLPHISSRFDPDIQGGTSLDDRDKSIVMRTMSRLSRAFSASSAKPQCQQPAALASPAGGGCSSKVVPEVLVEGGYVRKPSQGTLFTTASFSSFKDHTLRSCKSGGLSRTTSLAPTVTFAAPSADDGSGDGGGGRPGPAVRSPTAQTTAAPALSAAGSLLRRDQHDSGGSGESEDRRASSDRRVSLGAITPVVYTSGMVRPPDGNRGSRRSMLELAPIV